MGPNRIRRLSSRLCLLVFLVIIAACGSEDKASAPTQDTVETKAVVVFDASNSLIKVTKPGAEVSSTLISPCSISFEETEIAYSLVDKQHLKLGGDVLTYIRDLAKPSSVQDVPDAVFAVWSLPTQVVDGISYKVEVEIQAESLIYRNTCSR